MEKKNKNIRYVCCESKEKKYTNSSKIYSKIHSLCDTIVIPNYGKNGDIENNCVNCFEKIEWHTRLVELFDHVASGSGERVYDGWFDRSVGPYVCQ